MLPWQPFDVVRSILLHIIPCQGKYSATCTVSSHLLDPLQWVSVFALEDV